STLKQLSAALPMPGDTVKPSTTIKDAPHDPSSLRVALFTFSSSENGVAFSCALDGGAFRLCPPDGFPGLRPGRHQLVAQATDAAGNVGPATKPFEWTVDDSRIAFESIRDGRAQIFSANSDGSETRNLSSSATNDYDPAWSP